MTSERKKLGIIVQVAIFFIVAVLITGVLTYFVQRMFSYSAVRLQTETIGEEVAQEVILSVKEYPAYEWLLNYWYDHRNEMYVEYDGDFTTDTNTERKCRLFNGHHPDINLRYINEEEIRALPEEEQKLYAEIAYSWLITRVNQIKRTYKMDFLFCVVPEDDYKTQMFLFSASDPGQKRGTHYENVYTLGTVVSVADNESQQDAMKLAKSRYDNGEEDSGSAHLADAGIYMDYYAFLGKAGEHDVLIGLSYNVEGLRDNVNRQTVRGTAIAMAFQICLALICLGLIYHFVIKPLKKVQQNIRLYKQTNDSETVRRNLAEVRPQNEIGQLSEDIVDLSESIDKYVNRIETITAEKERIGVELSLASRIQASTLPNIFPPFPERKEFDIYASMDPAKEVGGDFYDFFMIDDDHIALLIADVSGKGVPAALFMMISMILVHLEAEDSMSPAEVLRSVNERICAKNPEEMFVSVWMGVLEISTGKLTAANAGHEYPVLMNPGGDFELIKDKHGFVIGGMDGIVYKDYELQMKPGSKLFVYTDGLPEATDGDNNMFGTDRMLETLNSDKDQIPKGVLKNITAAVDDFVKDAEQFDDLTMMCVTYFGPNGSSSAQDK